MYRKILFIAPDYYGFNEVVFEGLKKYSNAEVSHIISNKSYKYQNFLEKLENFFSKLLFKKNLKKAKSEKKLTDTIAELEDIDLAIINRPDLLNNVQLDLVVKNSKKTITILWDSLDKIQIEESILKKFDQVLSFDQKDCEKYHFKKITNFYFQKETNIANNFDVAFLGTLDDRFPILLDIFDVLKEKGLKIKGKIYSYHSQKISDKHSDIIENINKIIPFNSSFNYYLDAFAILDLAQKNQAGLSFRPFEAMGLEKKLITTNLNIKNYDFYDAHNILIIEENKVLNFPEDFFATPYKKLPKEISEKYSLKNWIQTIVNYS